MQKYFTITTFFLCSALFVACEANDKTNPTSEEKTLTEEEKLELQWTDFIKAIESGDKENLNGFIEIHDSYAKENWEDVTIDEPEFYDQLKDLKFSELSVDEYNKNQKTVFIHFETFFEGVKYESAVVFFFEVIEGKIKIVNVELYG